MQAGATAPDGGVRVAVVAVVDEAGAAPSALPVNVRYAGLVAASARLGARADLLLLAPPAPASRRFASPPVVPEWGSSARLTLPLTGETIRVSMIPRQAEARDSHPRRPARVDAVVAAPHAGWLADVRGVLRAGRSGGAVTVLNVEPGVGAALALVPDVDVVSINLRDDAGWAAAGTHGRAAVERLGAALLRRGPELVSVSAGSLGTYFGWADSRVWWPSPAAADRAAPGPVIEALTAGLAVALAEKQPTPEATRFAAAVAALATRLTGPLRPLPSRRQVQLLLAEQWAGQITVAPATRREGVTA